MKASSTAAIHLTDLRVGSATGLISKKRLLLHTAIDKRKKQAYNKLVGWLRLTQTKSLGGKNDETKARNP